MSMVSKAVQDAMDIRGMSRNETAKLANVCQSSLQRLCCVQQGMRLEDLERVFNVLGLTVSIARPNV